MSGLGVQHIFCFKSSLSADLRIHLRIHLREAGSRGGSREANEVAFGLIQA